MKNNLHLLLNGGHWEDWVVDLVVTLVMVMLFLKGWMDYIGR